MTDKKKRVKREPTVEFLKWLQEDLWREDGHITQTNKSRPWKTRKIPRYKERRTLYRTEWRTIIEAAKEHKIACAVGCADFGFRFSLYLYDAPEFPIAPGAPVEDNNPILVISWNHLPATSYKNLEMSEKSYDRKFNAYWKYFKELFDTPTNHELLVDYNLPKVKKADYYRY